jgi:hypothetical protein
MLEEALSTVGIHIRELADYVASEDYKVVKLHGSTNWAREVNTPIDKIHDLNTWQVAEKLMDQAAKLDISQRYRIVGGHPIGKESDDTPLFPALAIPVETKRDYECPEAHLEVLRDCIGKVTRLLFIGWRAMESHFLGLLRDNLPPGHIRAMVVSGSLKKRTELPRELGKQGSRRSFF